MTDVLLLPVLVAAIVLAGVLHEVTHMLAILPVAESASYQLPEHEVIAYVDDVEWKQRWANVAGVSPAICGVLFLFLLLWYDLAVPLEVTLESLTLWMPWFIYTVGGGWADYLPSRSVSEASVGE